MDFINADKKYDEAFEILLSKITGLDSQSVSLLICQSLNGFILDSEQEINFQEEVKFLLEFLKTEHEKNSLILKYNEKELTPKNLKRIYILTLPCLSGNGKDSISMYKEDSLEKVTSANVLTIQYKNCLLNVVDI